MKILEDFLNSDLNTYFVGGMFRSLTSLLCTFFFVFFFFQSLCSKYLGIWNIVLFLIVIYRKEKEMYDFGDRYVHEPSYP